jgi:hypothetical protein
LKLDAPKNNNYAAVVVAVHTIVDLEGLDNLVAVPAVGHQALTTRGIQAGELRVAFTAETQLSEDFCYHNSLYRDETLNADPEEKGYLEKNRRVRALKLRGHTSNALLMPVQSLAYTGFPVGSFTEGDTFDTLNGHEVCRKYEIPVRHHQQKSKIEKAFKRVDHKLFPEHLETDQYWRNKHLLKAGREVVITQKLHGTSWRGGNVPVRRRLRWYERFAKLLGLQIPEYEYDVVFGSRKVIKDPNNPNQQHYYKSDLWTEYGDKIAELIPEGFILYGELVGWVPGSDGVPMQKGYTYHLGEGEAELYIYRVSHINTQGHLSDLSWDGVKEFCRARGLKWVPELDRFPAWEHMDTQVEQYLDTRYYDHHQDFPQGLFREQPLELSDPKSVDEGICIRQEGLVPLVLKAKSPEFLRHETRLLDKGEADLESIN